MEIGNIIPHIEALIFASDKPLTSLEITELINNAFGFMEEKLTLEQIQTSIDGIREKYATEFYPFEVRESGGGWQFLTKRDFHKTIAQLNGDKFLKRLSSAALETLAIIAYKQPITKGEIEAIRGVSSDYSIQKLLEKELIVITGRNEDMPGKPLVYSTSKTFMDYFGINSAADLPKLKEIFAETIVEPTVIKHGATETIAEEETDTDKILAVAENGELIVHSEVESDEVADGEAADVENAETGSELNVVNDHDQAEESDEVADEELADAETAEASETGDDIAEENEDGEDNDEEDEAGDDIADEGEGDEGEVDEAEGEGDEDEDKGEVAEEDEDDLDEEDEDGEEKEAGDDIADEGDGVGEDEGDDVGEDEEDGEDEDEEDGEDEDDEEAGDDNEADDEDGDDVNEHDNEGGSGENADKERHDKEHPEK